MKFKALIIIYLFFFINIFLLNADEHLELGNPSNAVKDIYSNRNYLIERDQYALSYDNESGIPNWVSWHLGIKDFGDAKRSSSFYTDNSLPEGWYKVSHSDYTNGGFDRGHMCPSADRNSSKEANKETFYMTNIVPQTASNNQGPWAVFENYLRDLVRNKGKEIYIVSGPWGLSNGSIKSENKVKIPTSTWKVALILDEGPNDLKRVDNNTVVIAIEIPNEDSLDRDWRKYLTTVDYIEHLTNYDLFSEIDDAVEDVIESKLFDGQI
jgi:endonuclease G